MDLEQFDFILKSHCRSVQSNSLPNKRSICGLDARRETAALRLRVLTRRWSTRSLYGLPYNTLKHRAWVGAEGYQNATLNSRQHQHFYWLCKSMKLIIPQWTAGEDMVRTSWAWAQKSCITIPKNPLWPQHDGHLQVLFQNNFIFLSFFNLWYIHQKTLVISFTF